MHGTNRTHKRNFQVQWRQSPDITPVHDKQNKDFKDFTS